MRPLESLLAILLAGRLDLERVAVMGRSAGGSAAGHLGFTDVSQCGRFSLFRRMAPVGEIGGRRCQRVLGDYVLAFLGEHLMGRESPLLDGPHPGYPEVEISTRNLGSPK